MAALLLVGALGLRAFWQAKQPSTRSASSPAMDDSAAELFTNPPPLPGSDRDRLAAIRARLPSNVSSLSQEARFQTAQGMLQAGDLWQAETLLRGMLKQDAHSRPARLLLADTLREQARFAAARELYAALNREAPADVEPYLGLSSIATLLHEPKQAEDWLAKATAQGAANGDNLIQIARRYQDLDSFSLAQQTLEKALQILPDNAQVKLQQAALLVRYGAIDQAYPLLERLVREQPREGYAYRLLAVVLMNPTSAHYDLSRARSLLEQAVEFNVKDTEIYRLAAVIYRQLHLYRLAVQAYYALLTLEPASADARYELGQMYALLNRPDLSKPQLLLSEQLRALDRQQTLFTSAIYQHPQDGRTRFEYGLFLEKREHYAEALRAFQQAVNLSPNAPDIRAHLRQFYTRMQWRMPEGHNL